MSWIIRRIAALHPAMQGFLAFCLWNVLFVLGLLALENHHYTVVRFWIAAGAIGIMSVARGAARLFWPEEWNLIEKQK